jgi:phosphoesterase RecJ-like protein
MTPEDLAAVPAGAVDLLLTSKRVLAIGHESPDADAFGSALGVALAVEWLGGQATPMSSDPVPGMYAFMPRIERIRAEPDPDIAYDLIVISDSGELSRVGRVAREHAELFGRVPILVVDHHASNPGFGAVDWVDPAAAAASEQVALLVARLGVPLGSFEGAIAADLMAGIIGDTAMFQHSNVTPRTLRVASDLVAAGAPMSEVARLLYRSKPNEQLRLFGIVLGRLQASPDGRLVWATLLPADLELAGATIDQSEGIIDLLAQSASAEVAILFRDQGERTRISTRTRDGGVDAIALTRSFGGGGHPRAAGATVEQPIDAAQDAVLARARQLIDALGSR